MRWVLQRGWSFVFSLTPALSRLQSWRRQSTRRERGPVTRDYDADRHADSLSHRLQCFVMDSLWERAGVRVAMLLVLPSVLFSREVIILQGADGTPDYAKLFATQVSEWQAATPCTIIKDRATLETSLQKPGSDPLWLVMIGHGTFDGRDAKFNLTGDDVSAADVAGWLTPLKREVIVLNFAAGSGAFVKPLAGAQRVIVSSTKGGDELSFPRFGQHFTQAITGKATADLDQDQQVSVLEAFLYAAKKVDDFYATDQRIPTEHALIEDNGDGSGTRSEAFEVLRAKNAKADGMRASQIVLVPSVAESKLSPDQVKQRDALEAHVRVLVEKRASMKDDDYYRQLEALFVQLAKLSAK
jgi:hypothetical protein